MISEAAKRRAVYFHGVAHYPVNVCMHCNEEDDPESYWGEDADGDRICRTCERELTDEESETFPRLSPVLRSITEYQLEQINRTRSET